MSTHALSIVSARLRSSSATDHRPDHPLAGRRILLVEGDTRHVLAIESALTRHGAEVVLARSANDARIVLEASAAFDAAVVAVSLPDGRGASLVQALRCAARPCMAVMRTEPRSPSAVREIVGAGAVELLSATRPLQAVVEAVARTVAATGRLRAQLEALEAPCTGPQTPPSERLVRLPVHSVPAKPRRGRRQTHDLEGAITKLATRAGLSPREQSVLRFIAIGYRHQDIGAALEISSRTVKMHAANVRRKVGVSTRHELLREMFELEGASCR